MSAEAALFASQLVNGLQLGVMLFLLAAGLTLIFGVMDFMNLAHGSFYMVGAYVFGSLLLASDNFVLALLLALPLTALVGLAVELLIAQRLYMRSHLDQVLATFGLLLMLDATVHFFWGAEGLNVPTPDWLGGRVGLFGVELPVYRAAIIAVGLAVALGLYAMVQKTRLGMLIRAGASNRTMAQALGVDIGRLFAMVFAIGAAVAGLAGMMISPITGTSIGMGSEIIITAFVVVIIGGVGSIGGAFAGAMIVGVIDTLGRAYLDVLLAQVMTVENAETAAPALSAMLIYVIMAAVLVLKPQGLFPPQTR
ncbi:MAG: branched-chain amino acid ABC transporter permease [Pseudomonadota bacterium]